MRTLYSVLLLTFFVSLQALAQTGELQGKIVDAETGQGLPFATIVVMQNDVQRGGSYTDDNGNYTIKPLQPGNYTIKTSYASYNPVSVEGVIVSSDKITFENIRMSKTITTITEVVITAERKLVDPDQTQTGDTKTRTEIQQLATNRNNANDIIGTAAGVFQRDDGRGINVGGSRSSSNRYYVDGIPMRGTINLPSQAVEQITLITGGIPAKYGDATGGIINMTTRGPSREFFGGVEGATSEFLDPYGYKLLNFSLAGPLLSRYRRTDTADTRLGFFLTAEYEGNRDAFPSAVGMWKVKDDVLNDIRTRPLQPAEIGEGFVNRANFITRDDMEETKVKQNVTDNAYRWSTKFDVKLNRYANLVFGGNADLNRYNNYSYTFQLFAPEHNLDVREQTYRGFVRFTQRFAPNVNRENTGVATFQNAFYSIQADYSKFFQNFEDKNIGDNPFHYGYVGKFRTYRTPLYAPGADTATGLYGLQLIGYADTLVTFEPGTLNPDLTAYTSTYYELAGSTPVDGVYGLNGNPDYFRSLGLIVNRGGLINGFLPGNIYSLWRPTGFPAGEIRRVNNTQYRLAFNGSVDIVRQSATSRGDRNRHAVEFGFEYEQRDDRGWRVFPTDGTGLWGLARQLTNRHILSLDLSNPHPVYVDGVFQDTIRYDRLVGPNQSYFDLQLRNMLNAGATEFIDVDALDPNSLSLDMFSPDELFNNGNNYIQYWGYDWKGNKLTSQPDFFDFFDSEVDANGRRINDRPIGAFRPIYTAAYIQDKFNFRDLIFNIGVRVDRYDANQKVLRDPYSLFPIRTAGDVSNINDDDITHPANIGNDYYVYVNNPENPSQVVGYRDGEQWYDATGAPIADPEILAQSTATGIIAPYLQAGFTRNSPISRDGFRDYEPQWSVMPRIAFSFPISENALFFAHYDVLTQRPAFNRTSPFDYQYLRDIAVNARFNNPNLRPEKTIDYQVGFQQALGRNAALTLSLQYKELKDMVQVRRIVYAIPIDYTTYGNLDFGTVKSFQASYEMRRTRNVRLEANYTLQFAEGTGSSETSSLNLIGAGQPNLRTIVPFSYDQRHTITTTLDYRFSEGKAYNGPVVGKNQYQLLKNTGLNTIFRVGSGTPFTRQENPTPEALFGVATNTTLKGNINGSRLPYTFKIDARLDRDFSLITKENRKTLSMNAYILVMNLLNTRNVVAVYNYSGSPDDDGYLTSPIGEQSIVNKLNEQSYVDLYNIKMLNPDHFTLPRRIRFGLQLNF